MINGICKNSLISRSSLFYSIRFSSSFVKVKLDDDFLQRMNDSTEELAVKNSTSKIVDRKTLNTSRNHSVFRDANGDLIGDMKNAEEARLTPRTLEGRCDRSEVKINAEIEKVIRNNILSLHHPKFLRQSTAKQYLEMQETGLHRQTNSKMEVDAHVGSIFVQNYASITQCLSELQKRVGISNFKPDRVLDVGFGPATGMVALNDLLGDDYKPSVKDAVIIGSLEMEKRAKIILSRQINEVPTSAIENKEQVEDNEKYMDVESNETAIETENDDINEVDDLVGEVMTKKIKIVTKLKNSVPKTGQYDLIILTHQLLKKRNQFPIQIDESIEKFLHLLAPGGHIIIVERGNPLGFEIVARARQVMIRPENYPDEVGKIPRPWLRGSTVKTSSKDITLDEKEKSLSPELQFEPELFEAIKKMNNNNKEIDESKLDYHLKILGPCPHHKKCPLQIGNPSFYEYPGGGRLNFCNFQKSVTRPKFNMELKKGKILATKWQSPTDGIGIEGLAQPGGGRPNGRNNEICNYSYLIVERSMNDEKTIAEINKLRLEKKATDTVDTWPRILKHPNKNKGHVAMELCGSDGILEKWIVPKSLNKEWYHDARKSQKGDLWALGAKTKIKSKGDLNVTKLEAHHKQKIKSMKIEEKNKNLALQKRYESIINDDGLFENTPEVVEEISKIYGNDHNQNYRKKN